MRDDEISFSIESIRISINRRNEREREEKQDKK